MAKKTTYEELEQRVKELEKENLLLKEHKHSTETLQERESRYRAVVENQTEMICCFLPDKTITFVNDAYCRFFNKKRKELIGKKFAALIPQSDRKKVLETISSLSSDVSIVTLEHPVLAPDKKLCWHRWTNRAIFDDQNNLLEYQAVGWDITERKRAKEALKESEEKYRHLSEGTFEAVVWHNKGKIIEANKQYYELFGCNFINSNPWFSKVYEGTDIFRSSGTIRSRRNEKRRDRVSCGNPSQNDERWREDG
jgi:PAS domain S-box-containing protein